MPVVLAALFGISADTKARHVGVAAAPDAGPMKPEPADSVVNPIARVPDVVIGDPPIVNPVGTVAATLVTDPPDAGVLQVGTPPATISTCPVVPMPRRCAVPPLPPSIKSPAVVIGLAKPPPPVPHAIPVELTTPAVAVRHPLSPVASVVVPVAERLVKEPVFGADEPIGPGEVRNGLKSDCTATRGAALALSIWNPLNGVTPLTAVPVAG